VQDVHLARAARRLRGRAAPPQPIVGISAIVPAGARLRQYTAVRDVKRALLELESGFVAPDRREAQQDGLMHGSARTHIDMPLSSAPAIGLPRRCGRYATCSSVYSTSTEIGMPERTPRIGSRTTSLKRAETRQ
jgi:hypothetical protein